MQVTGLQVGVVDGGDLQFPAFARLDPLRDVDDPPVIEVQADDRVVGLRGGGLLLDAQGPAVRGELHDAVALRVGDLVGEDGAALRVAAVGQGGGEVVAVEDVVAEGQRHVVVADEVLADEERLRQPVRRGLVGVVDHEPPLGSVAEEASESGGVLRRRDDQDLPDPRLNERGQRVVDHRLVVDRHELLRDALRDRIQPRPGAAGEDDALHRRYSARPTRQFCGTKPVASIFAVLSVLIDGRLACAFPSKYRSLVTGCTMSGSRCRPV